MLTIFESKRYIHRYNIGNVTQTAVPMYVYLTLKESQDTHRSSANITNVGTACM